MEKFESISEFTEYLKQFFTQEKLEKESSPYCNVEIPYNCLSFNEKFRIYSLEIIYHKCLEEYEIDINYNVVKCSYDDDETFTIYQLKTIEDCVDKLFEVLWDNELCSECLSLVPKDKKLCQKCYNGKLMWEWGVNKGRTVTMEKCAICLEDVYSSKLSCGHRFHKTCFINLNREEWFDHTIEVKCPVCRREITDLDKKNYFLYS